MNAWYNEIEPYAAQWIENLATAGHVAAGTVERRSVRDLEAGDVPVGGQCHFFAGVGGWARALRLAGWPDDLAVWTGSCPCQPFSDAGQKRGFADDRHLWPAWFELILEHRPSIIFGEQVASAPGLAWLDAVQADLEGAGYTFGASDLCVAGVGAPHIRQRLYFVAVSDSLERRLYVPRWQSRRADIEAIRSGEARVLADHEIMRRVEGIASHRVVSQGEDGSRPSDCERMGGATRGFWGSAEWVYCRDEKWRPVEPGSFPLAHGVPARVGRLRGFGNAISPQVGAVFIEAAMSWVVDDVT